MGHVRAGYSSRTPLPTTIIEPYAWQATLVSLYYAKSLSGASKCTARCIIGLRVRGNDNAGSLVQNADFPHYLSPSRSLPAEIISPQPHLCLNVGRSLLMYSLHVYSVVQ